MSGKETLGKTKKGKRGKTKKEIDRNEEEMKEKGDIEKKTKRESI